MRSITYLILFLLSNNLFSQPPTLIKRVDHPSHLTVCGDTMYFSAVDTCGCELWMCTADSNICKRVKDINPGGGDALHYPTTSSSLPDPYFIKFRDHVFFVANDGTHGNEVWKTDGTDTGTVLLKDINNGLGNAFSQFQRACFTIYHDMLYFVANDSQIHYSYYVSDGTTAGTIPVIFPGGSGSGASYLSCPLVYNNSLYLVGDGGSWLMDSTNAIQPAVQNDYCSDAITVGNKIFGWGAYIHPGVSDGTVGGSFCLNNTCEVTTTYGNAKTFVEYNGDVYFSANNFINGKELWKTDGTVAGTFMLKDIYPGHGNGFDPYLCSPISFNGLLWFGADDSIHGTQLWVSDGTSAGTQMVTSFLGHNSYSLYTLLPASNNKVYFNKYSEPNIFVSNGTTAGTMLAVNAYSSRYIVEFDSSIYFNAEMTPGKDWLYKLGLSTIGIDELADKVNSCFVFPNPGQAGFNLHFDKQFISGTCALYNSLGERVFYEKLNGSEIRIPDTFKEGLYLVSVSDGKQSCVSKIILE